ncbi:MAG: PVC-type heme-binding CxxCH protein [Planctomycetota bacterium]
MKHLAWLLPLLFGFATSSRAQLSPEKALEDLETLAGLEVSLYASEPLIASPTNLDIDERGRVWVCEVLNYHRNRGRRDAGDRILILEDRDGDGKADATKVYFQGRDVDSAMGICVLGNRVIVTSSPNVWVFTDLDGDDKPDRQELLFTKTGHPEHDHSAHSFVFGPDGRLYWNFGNTGQGVYDRNGNVVVDRLGHRVLDNRQPYQGGMAFRCKLDGSSFEVLGHNFRNNYELAVDSFGNVWQTDNDDDGNRGARMSFVMEGGNYGYRDELTGAGWRTKRTGQSSDVSARHFHQNDPGVVPNCIVTGNGAPGGIVSYEGAMLPQKLQGQLIHTDTVTNAVYADLIETDGAGFRGRFIPILKSRKDRWFRPVDVCVAVDGSLFVTDWYDPGVGGHRQADTQRGRIYRISTPSTAYTPRTAEVRTVDEAITHLRSANHAVRYTASTALRRFGSRAESALQQRLSSSDSRLQARVLWILGDLPQRGEVWARQYLTHEDPNLRITAFRIARKLGLDVTEIGASLMKDPSPAVRREVAIALQGLEGRSADGLWAELASRHDGADRWYLEALGIGAKGQWDRRYAAWTRRDDSTQPGAGVRDLIWRSRAQSVPVHLAKLILSTPSNESRLRYFRAFDFHTGPRREAALRRC